MNIFGKILCTMLLVGTFSDVKAASYRHSMQKCQELVQNNPPKIQIFYNYGKLKYNTDKTAEELEKIYDEIMPNNGSKNIRGLTLLAPHMDFNIYIRDLNIDDYRCFYPQSIDVHLRYNPTIYLVNTLIPDSCLYNLTLRHEHTHLDIGYHLLTDFARSLKSQIQQIIDNTGIKMAAIGDPNSRQEEGSSLNALYQEQIKVLFHRFTAELIEHNQVIDSKENYKEESLLCPKSN